MINIKFYLYENIKRIIENWNEKDIYAISFFVYSNESFTYQQYNNISEFSISYNTEEYCCNASEYSEKRWNYAFWRQNTTKIISTENKNNEGVKILFQWYKENGIENIGFEDFNNIYDDKMYYIGKGPIGYYELLTIVSDVARQLQIDGTILHKFGKIPIIVHDLEYGWYVEEATRNANPNGEAEVFLEALNRGFE